MASVHVIQPVKKMAAYLRGSQSPIVTMERPTPNRVITRFDKHRNRSRKEGLATRRLRGVSRILSKYL
jgi:hypothetical protein